MMSEVDIELEFRGKLSERYQKYRHCER